MWWPDGSSICKTANSHTQPGFFSQYNTDTPSTDCRDTLSNLYPLPDRGRPFGNTDPYGYQSADGNGNTNGNTNRNRHSNAHADGHTYANSHKYRDPNGHQNPDSKPNTNQDPYPDSKPYPNDDEYPNSEQHPGSDAFTYGRFHQYTHTNRESHLYQHPPVIRDPFRRLIRKNEKNSPFSQKYDHGFRALRL